MKVREIAKVLGVSTDTVRYYVREGLITPIKDPDNGYRVFLRRDIDRFRFILAARQLGFSIGDIQEILTLSDAGDVPCPRVKELIQVRLEETEVRFQELLKLRTKMKKALLDWQDKPNESPSGHNICHLIEHFYQESQDDV